MNEERITDAELEILKILWLKQPASAKEISLRIESHAWSEKTVRTLISRLLQKGIIQVNKQGKEYVFQTTISKQEYQNYVTKSIANKVFQGSMSSMALHVLQDVSLSKEDVQELKDLLARYED